MPKPSGLLKGRSGRSGAKIGGYVTYP